MSKRRHVKKIVVLLMTTMLLVMQVMTASAVVETVYSTDWKLIQAEWELRNYDSSIAPGIIKYTCSGSTINNTPMDYGNVEMIILRKQTTSLIEEYNYDAEFVSFLEDYVLSGDMTQTGESICHVYFEDNYFGYISEVIYNEN